MPVSVNKAKPLSIRDLPAISSILFPKNYRLLPNTTEIFELELAFKEFNVLSKPEVIERGAYFERVDNALTNHYLICTNSSSLMWQGRSETARAYFKEGSFSTGYATHGLFPYRGKFHPQMIKAILNILGIKKGDVVLDPMCGSGTLNVEAALMGIDSIGIEKSPFCVLMSTVKYNALNASIDQLAKAKQNQTSNFMILQSSKTVPNRFRNVKSANMAQPLTLLAFLDAMGYSRRCSKNIDTLYPIVLTRYIEQTKSFTHIRKKLNLTVGDAHFKIGDAKKLPLENNSVDAIVTSPPYSFAIDYAENDKPQLEYLGYTVADLKRSMIGLKGKTRKDKLANYFDDMHAVLAEISRVLKTGRYAVIVIGSNDIQTGGVRLENMVIEYAHDAGLHLEHEIVKPIKGIRNTMKEEYILFFIKGE